MISGSSQTPYVTLALCSECGQQFSALAWRNPDDPSEIEHSEHCEACLEKFIADEAAFASAVWDRFYGKDN